LEFRRLHVSIAVAVVMQSSDLLFCSSDQATLMHRDSIF